MRLAHAHDRQAGLRNRQIFSMVLTLCLVMSARRVLFDVYQEGVELCLDGKRLQSKVCSHMGLGDAQDHSTDTISERSISMLLRSGIRCMDLDVFWDADGVFYLGHPAAVLKSYNLTLEEISSLTASQLLGRVRTSQPHQPSWAKAQGTARIADLFMSLDHFLGIVRRYQMIGPVNLELKGQQLPSYRANAVRLANTLQHHDFAAGKFSLQFSKVEDIRYVRTHTSITAGPKGADSLARQLVRGPRRKADPHILFALSFRDRPRSEAELAAAAPGLYQGELVATKVLVQRRRGGIDPVPYLNLSTQLQATNRAIVDVLLPPASLYNPNTDFITQLASAGKAVGVWNLDLLDFNSLKEVIRSPASPKCLITNSPQALSAQLQAECGRVSADRIPRSPPPDSESEEKFWLIWGHFL